MKLIDSIKAEKLMRELFEKHDDVRSDVFNAGVYACLKIIQDMMLYDSIQAEPIRHGKWIKKDNWYFCSECGEEMFFTGTYDKSQHYCYNCGACMVKQGDITTE